MSVQTPSAPQLWAVEPSTVDGHARVRARIAGLHCSLCTGTIEKALGRMDGVGQVAVSLTHEQALVDYDPGMVAPERILSTLRDIGYELYDPRKLRPFEEEERQHVGRHQNQPYPGLHPARQAAPGMPDAGLSRAHRRNSTLPAVAWRTQSPE